MPGRTLRAPSPRDGETEQRILDAARRVFLRDGTAGTRMQEIAREAGVNQALLHYYFRSKERLSTAVFQQIAGRIFPTIAQVLTGPSSLDDKIDRLVATYLDTLAANPFIPAYIISELHHHPDRIQHALTGVMGSDPRPVMRSVLQQLGKQIDERVRAGKMRDITPQEFVINLLSLCVFPFAAKPMFEIILGMDDAAFKRFIRQRKKELPEFFRNALKP
ncbi:MAG TPA: TetR/AcrR family transcriptional regulator [Gemmatimonadaceae bacterium]|jgi:AcrR family transcriptional regulator|nr:TetR/AcrR family transcriptional regulator [Gemmatimonadaceae bacterium]